MKLLLMPCSSSSGVWHTDRAGERQTTSPLDSCCIAEEICLQPKP